MPRPAGPRTEGVLRVEPKEETPLFWLSLSGAIGLLGPFFPGSGTILAALAVAAGILLLLRR